MSKPYTLFFRDPKPLQISDAPQLDVFISHSLRNAVLELDARILRDILFNGDGDAPETIPKDCDE